MWCKKNLLSAIAGLSLLSIPLGATAAVNRDRSSAQMISTWQMPSRHPSVVIAYEDEPYPWHHHHHYVNPPLPPNDYSWGTRNRYQYAPGWFNSPPAGWAIERRRAYLEERRHVAIDMQRQMLARGDTRAAQRLGVVIAQLDHQLHYR
jgi:hypothetical protein